MNMEFPYLRLGNHDARPYIPVSIKFKKKSESTIALIDSGADFTFIPLDIAKKVGLKLDPKKTTIVVGVGGNMGAYKTHATLVFHINENDIELRRVPVLVPKKKDFYYTLLGRDHFFNEFNISFDENKKKVILDKV